VWGGVGGWWNISGDLGGLGDGARTVSDGQSGWGGHSDGLVLVNEGGWLWAVSGELGDNIGDGSLVSVSYVRVSSQSGTSKSQSSDDRELHFCC